MPMRSIIGGSVSGYLPITALDWWLSGSAVDLDFETPQYYDSSVGTGTDPNLATTVLMLHGDGTNGASNISDSTGRHRAHHYGGVFTTDTAQSKFGGSSIRIPSGAALIMQGNGADVGFGTGDFTFDGWFRLNTNPASIKGVFETKSFSGAGAVWLFLYIDSSNHLILEVSGGGANITGTTALTTATWYHFALVRSSGSTKLYLNGTQEGSTYSDSNNYVDGDGTGFTIGNNYNAIFPLDAWAEEVRILKGTAAWTANFTAPTAPYDVGIGPYDMLSCSRASVGYAQTVAGTLTQFAANQLRITDKGLLVEDTRTNLVLQSADFSTNWTVHPNITLTVDNVAAPDGTVTADKLQINTAAANNYCRSANIPTTVSAGVVHTVSAYVKSTSPWVMLQLSDNTANNFSSWFNLSTVAVGSTSVVGDGVVDTTSIEALANGWFRIILSGHLGSSHANCGVYLFPCLSGDSSVTSVLNDILYAWGAQAEAGAFASSYIPTTTGSVTRAADAVTAIGTFVSVLGGVAGSVCADIKTLAIPTGFWRVVGRSSGPENAMQVNNGVNTEIAAYNAINPALTATFGAGTLTGGVKVASAWDASPTRSTVGGGGTVAPDAGVTIASDALGGATMPYIYYRRVTAWTSKLADATLQGFTAP